MSNKNQPYEELEYHVEVSVRRKRDEYYADTLGKVNTTETVIIPAGADDQRHDHLLRIMEEAQDKVIAATGIRREFERNMLALESGDTIDA